MARPGLPWIIDKDTIATILKKHSGVLTRCAKELDVAPHTLRLKIQEYPELVKILADERNSFETTMLDMAENTLMYAMGLQKSDVNAALKASFYALNNKGRERGYQRIKGDEDGGDNSIENLKKALREFSRAQESGGSEVEAEQSLLD